MPSRAREPLGMRGERESWIATTVGTRRKSGARVAGREEDVEVIARSHGRQPHLLPPRAAGALDEPRRETGAPSSATAERLGRVEHELVAPRAVVGPLAAAARRDSGRRRSGGRTARARRCRCASALSAARCAASIARRACGRAVSLQRNCRDRCEAPAPPARRERRRRRADDRARTPGRRRPRPRRAARRRRALRAGRRDWRRRPARRWSSPRAPAGRSPLRTRAGRARGRLRTAARRSAGST